MRGALGRVIPSPSFDYGPATPDPSLRNPLPTGEGKICQAALRTSATIFFAASPRSLAGTIASPELARISLPLRSEEHTSELQSLMRISYAVFCLKKKKNNDSMQNRAQHHTYHNTRRYSTA